MLKTFENDLNNLATRAFRLLKDAVRREDESPITKMEGFYNIKSLVDAIGESVIDETVIKEHKLYELTPCDRDVDGKPTPVRHLLNVLHCVIQLRRQPRRNTSFPHSLKTPNMFCRYAMKRMLRKLAPFEQAQKSKNPCLFEQTATALMCVVEDYITLAAFCEEITPGLEQLRTMVTLQRTEVVSAQTMITAALYCLPNALSEVGWEQRCTRNLLDSARWFLETRYPEYWGYHDIDHTLDMELFRMEGLGVSDRIDVYGRGELEVINDVLDRIVATGDAGKALSMALMIKTSRMFFDYEARPVLIFARCVEKRLKHTVEEYYSSGVVGDKQYLAKVWKEGAHDRSKKALSEFISKDGMLYRNCGVSGDVLYNKFYEFVGIVYEELRATRDILVLAWRESAVAALSDLLKIATKEVWETYKMHHEQ